MGDVSISEIAKITSGKRPQKVEKFETTELRVPVIGGGGPSGFTDEPLYTGRILITGRVGTLGKLFAPDGPCWPSDNALVLWPKDDQTDFAFLRYALQQKITDAIGMNRGAANPLITQKDLGTLKVNHPSLSDQRSIASVLGAIDDKIELNRYMNKTLEALARALFKDWFVDFGPTRAKIGGREPYLDPDLWALFPDHLNEETSLPKGWEVSTIGDEVRVVGGSTPSTKESDFWDGPFNWATPKDLSTLTSPVLLETSRTITMAGLEKISSGLLPVGTVLLSSRAPIGYLAIADIPVAINQGFIAMVCEGRISNVFAWLWTIGNMEAILAKANGSTFQEISKGNFRPLPLVLPSDTIRAAFDAFVLPIYRRIEKNEKESRSLSQTRDLLLPKLMSGEIRLRDAEQIAEEAL